VHRILRTFALLAALGVAALPAQGALASPHPAHRGHARVHRRAARHRARSAPVGRADGGARYPAPRAIAAASGGASAPGAEQGASGATGVSGPSDPAAVSGGPTGGVAPPGTAVPSGSTATVGATGTTGATGSTGASGVTGPGGPLGPTPTVPGWQARILSDGLAAAPLDAPPAVRAIIAAGNQLIGEPYRYGGGHRSFVDDGYDCSGAVSYALHGAGLVVSPLDSTAFEAWGAAGAGEWVTVWTNPQHAFMEIAGIRLDTSAVGDPNGQSGPRWRPAPRPRAGFAARHPPGL